MVQTVLVAGVTFSRSTTPTPARITGSEVQTATKVARLQVGPQVLDDMCLARFVRNLKDNVSTVTATQRPGTDAITLVRSLYEGHPVRAEVCRTISEDSYALMVNPLDKPGDDHDYNRAQLFSWTWLIALTKAQCPCKIGGVCTYRLVRWAIGMPNPTRTLELVA